MINWLIWTLSNSKTASSLGLGKENVCEELFFGVKSFSASVWDNSLTILQLSNTEYKKRLAMAVDFTQINSLLDQKISTMSGGEKQRVVDLKEGDFG